MRTSRASVMPHAVMIIILMNIGAFAAFRWPSASDRAERGRQSQSLIATPGAFGCEPNTALPVVRPKPARGDSAALGGPISCLEVDRAR